MNMNMSIKLRAILLSVIGLLAAGSAQAACWPFDDIKDGTLKTKWINVPASAGTRYDYAVVYGCQSPTSVYTKVWLFTASEWAATLATTFATTASADARLAASTFDTPTAVETAYRQALFAQYKITGKVTGTTGATRPTYQLTADGSRGAVTTFRVNAGVACNPGVRARNSNYYSVEGQTASDGVTTLGKVVAICSLTTPTGLNQSAE